MSRQEDIIAETILETEAFFGNTGEKLKNAITAKQNQQNMGQSAANPRFLGGSTGGNGGATVEVLQQNQVVIQSSQAICNDLKQKMAATADNALSEGSNQSFGSK